MDCAGSDRSECAGSRHHALAAHATSVTPIRLVFGESHRRPPERIRRPCREEIMRTPVAVPLMRAPRKPGSRDKADPCTMVIFGGAGDLTKRKLIPAIYYLAEQKLLPDNFALLGVARDA